MAAPPDVYAILAVSTTKNPFGPESGTWTITPAFPVLKKLTLTGCYSVLKAVYSSFVNESINNIQQGKYYAGEAAEEN
jgi:hypothetical protein